MGCEVLQGTKKEGIFRPYEVMSPHIYITDK